MLCFRTCSLIVTPVHLAAKWTCSQKQNQTSSRERTFWVEPRHKSVLTAALEGGIQNFVFHPDVDPAGWSHLGRFNAVTVDGDGCFDGGIVLTLRSPKDVEDAVALAGSQSIVVIDPTDWKAIPAENIIAAFQGTPTQLFAVVDSPETAKSMLGMLETGVDGVVLRTSDPLHARNFCNVRDEALALNAEADGSFTFATVLAVRQVGSGERVCIDTCSILREDEGMLVGSSSKSMFLVLSEAAEVDYISSRPFRVNAGPVHSYCAVPGGKTKYLSELGAGDEVLIFGRNGKSCRRAVVGRAKVETRPLSLVVANIEGNPAAKATLFVQNAETVRLATLNEDGEMTMTSITKLRDGERLLARTDDRARHIGIAIAETIIEK